MHATFARPLAMRHAGNWRRNRGRDAARATAGSALHVLRGGTHWSHRPRRRWRSEFGFEFVHGLVKRAFKVDAARLGQDEHTPQAVRELVGEARVEKYGAAVLERLVCNPVPG